MDADDDSVWRRYRAERLRAHPAKATSQHNLQSIFSNLPTRALDLGSLGGTLDQNRIGVVDVNENTPGRQRIQGVQGSALPVDRHMAHPPAGLLPRACAEHLVIGEQRAVEKNDVRTRKAF